MGAQMFRGLKQKAKIQNVKYLEELKRAQRLGVVTKELLHIFQQQAYSLSFKDCFNHIRTSIDKEDYFQSAMIPMLRCWQRFDCDAKFNPFAYFTTVITHSYAQSYKDLYCTNKGSDNKVYRIKELVDKEEFIDECYGIIGCIENIFDDDIENLLKVVYDRRKSDNKTLFEDNKQAYLSEMKSVPEFTISKIQYRYKKNRKNGTSYVKWKDIAVLALVDEQWEFNVDAFARIYDECAGCDNFEIKVVHKPQASGTVCLDYGGESDVFSI